MREVFVCKCFTLSKFETRQPLKCRTRRVSPLCGDQAKIVKTKKNLLFLSFKCKGSFARLALRAKAPTALLQSALTDQPQKCRINLTSFLLIDFKQKCQSLHSRLRLIGSIWWRPKLSKVVGKKNLEPDYYCQALDNIFFKSLLVLIYLQKNCSLSKLLIHN